MTAEAEFDRRSARPWVVALVVYWVVLFTATHVPTPQLMAGAMELNADKLIHVTAYAVLATLMLGATRSLGWKRVGLLTIAVGIAYAAFDELSQPYVGRVCDPLDFAADAVGVLAAVGVDMVRR